MKSSAIALTIGVLVCLGTAAWGQQALPNTQVQDILQQVTSHPRNTWVTAGTIVATHTEHGDPKTTSETEIQSAITQASTQYAMSANTLEKSSAVGNDKANAIPFNIRYKLANKWDMTSTVTVKYDNGRFYWDIQVSSRSDSIKPADYGVAGNDMTDQFDLSGNRHRTFAWDGQEYTVYSAGTKQARIDAAGVLPHAVNGPLTAGLIPWGYGRYTLANLTAAQISTTKNANGTIGLKIAHTDGTSSNLTLDPARNYAVTSAVLTRNGATTTYTCSDYRKVGTNWNQVPYNIYIERRNTSKQNRMPTWERWAFSSVSVTKPAATSFQVPLVADTQVEYTAPIAAASALYVESNVTDTRGLLAQRLAYAATQGSRPQNCATAALQQIAAEFGKSVAESALTRLVGADGRTSLYDLKRLAQSQGLFCRAVQTDLATLQDLQNTKAILHIPGQDHFVVLQGVEGRNVWLADVSSRKFFYHKSVDSFPLDWPEGTALLVSDRPIPGQATELSDATAQGITGGAYYACNVLLQEQGMAMCDGPFIGCDSTCVYYYERWGCGSASSGSCTYSTYVRESESPCDNVFGGDDCAPNGDWFDYYMRACQ